MNDAFDPILQQEEQRKLHIQLMWRLGIAVLLVGGVLGILAWLDKANHLEQQISIASQPARAPVIIASEPAQSIANPATASTIASAASAIESPIASSPEGIASSVDSKPSTPPVVVNTPPQVASIVTPISLSHPSLPQASNPVAHTANTSHHKQETAPIHQNQAAIPVSDTPSPNNPIKLPSPDKLAQAPKAITLQYPAAVATPSGYIVQAGVFLHANNAEKLLSSVQNAGIPAYLETRVQIGPFNNKTEAEAAIKKLRQLGIEPVVKSNP